MRNRLAAVLEDEGGDLFCDPWEARNDYIEVVLRPDAETRQAFLARHAGRRLSVAEEIRAWEIMEAARHGLLMYASCGWFFADLAGLEAIQNLRLAVRALELAEKISAADAVRRVTEFLGEARSNYAGTAAELMAHYVLPTCYSAATIVAAHIFCRLLGLPLPSYQMEVALRDEPSAISPAGSQGVRCSEGQARVRDLRTGREVSYCYYAAVLSPAPAGVFVVDAAEKTKLESLKNLPLPKLAEEIERASIRPHHLPLAEREQILSRLFVEEQRDFSRQITRLQQRSVPLLRSYAAAGISAPPLMRCCAEHILGEQAREAIDHLATVGGDDEKAIAILQRLRQDAHDMGIELAMPGAARFFAEEIHRRIDAFSLALDNAAIAAVRRLLCLSRQFGAVPAAERMAQEAFWNFLHGAARLALQKKTAEEQQEIVESLIALGSEMGFASSAIEILPLFIAPQ